MAISLSKLHELLSSQILVADGAMGTVLAARGLTASPTYENANLNQPELVASVHREYIQAGARLIETNTFGANRVKLLAYGLEDSVEAINRAGARIARSAAGPDVLVAGAIGPCGKALAPLGAVAPQLAEATVRQQAMVLLQEGVDVIILETFNDIEELRIAHRVVRDLADIPIIVQKVFIEDGETLSEGLPARIITELASWPGVVAVGANCAIGPQRMLDVVRAMAQASPMAISAMPTPGLPQLVGANIRYAVTPEYFARYAKLLVEAGVNIIGGCCGTTPAHIAAVARAVASMPPAVRTIALPAQVTEPRERAPEAASDSDYSQFRRKLGKQYLKAVELDVPRGLDMGKVVQGARSMLEKGVDIIDISDGARARLRVTPVSVARMVQEQVGIEVMMHFACRDRNLLAVQADLLGAHLLGIRNILAITGDPANIGDYPAATSVYDVDSIGLVRVLRRFNEGIDLAGNSIGRATAFTIAVAFDPLANDLDREIDRLGRKVEEGAHVIYTQPIFERAILDRAVEAASRFKIPLLFGLLPLRSARHCEFMHNEVPGISIPDHIRAAISELNDEDARKYGIDVARTFLADVAPITQGVYLMPPFGSAKIAEQVLEAIPTV